MARTIPLIAALLCGAVTFAQDSYLFELDAPGAQPYVDLVGATPVQIFNVRVGTRFPRPRWAPHGSSAPHPLQDREAM